MADNAGKQAKGTNDIADRTLAQAVATNRLVTISRNQQRPYLWAIPRPKNPGGVIFRHLPMGRPAEGGPPNDQVAIDIDIEIKNGGLSPAINAIPSTPYIMMQPTRFFRWSEVKNDYLKYPEKVEGVIIGPSSSVLAKTGFVQRADANTMESIQGGGEIVYVVGSVTYTDIYQPDKRPYETTYCFILKPVPLMPNPGGPVEYDTAGNCPFGNHFK